MRAERPSRSARIAAGLLFAAAAGLLAQGSERMATTAEALVASPLFFHGRRVVVRHPTREANRLVELDATAKPVYVFWREPPSSSEGEIRGEFWDLGRMLEGDERFASYDFRPVIDAANNGHWPGRDQIFVLLGATLVPGPPPTAPTVRSIVMDPARFDGRTVTIGGRFRGRNLFGDLPQAVARSKWDFVIQAADAAVWITGLRPKGSSFDLDPGARVDTGRWLEVTGAVHRDGTAVWIAADSVRLATAPAEAPVEVAAPPTPPEPPPTVIFSAPLAGETDVPTAARVRIQFSRDMKPASFENHVRVRYAGPNAPGAPPASTAAYNDGTRALEIRFKEALARFQTVVVQLEAGVVAIDGQPLKPWALQFSTGG